MIGSRRLPGWSGLVLFAAQAVLLAACDAVPGTDRDPSTLVLLMEGDEWILSPTWDVSARFLTFSPLAEYTADWERAPLLARRWEHSPDYRTWTVRLRSDARWHDGTPFTAHDVKFTHDVTTHWMRELGRPVDFEIVVVDDTTYTKTYGRHARHYPISTWDTFMPKHLLGHLDPEGSSQWEYWTRPVGNGPYLYVRHVPKTMMELAANPDWFGGKPRIERVILKFVQAGQNALVELMSGNVDAVSSVSPTDALKIREDERFRVHHEVDPAVRKAIAWNLRHPPLRDVRVRRALTLALDRRELHRVLDLPDGLPLTDAIYTERAFRRGEIPPSLPFDVAEAIRLLEEAGWRDADGDGVREKDGVELRFTVPGQDQAAVWVQSQLRKVGAAMEIRPVTDIRRRVAEGEFEAAIGDFRITNRRFGHEAFYGRESRIGYDNPRVAELIAAADLQIDPEARDSIYRLIMPLVQEDLPMTMLAPRVHFSVTHRRVGGTERMVGAEIPANITKLWLEERR